MTRSTAPRPMAMMVYRAASDGLGKGAFFLVTLVAARQLSQDAFGIFSLGTTVGWIAAVATDFGIQLHTARAVAQHPGQAARLLGAWGRIRVATATLAIVAVGAGLLVTRTPVPIATAIFLLSLGYIAAAMLEFLYYVFRGLSRSDLESTLTVAQRTGTLCVALLVLWWRPDVRLLGAAMLLPVAAALWFALRWARQLVNQRHMDAEALQNRSVVAADAARAVFAIGAGIVLSALYFRIDVFLVNAWSGPAAVGLYNAVFRLVDALRLFPGAVIAVMLPALFRSGDGRLVTRLTFALGAGTTVAAAVLGAIAPWLVPALYGSSYADAVPAFRALLFALPLMAVNLALTHQLLGWQGQRAYACICGGALLFNLALNGFLIPRLGILGAAWTTVWTEAFVTVGCVVALFATGTRALPLSERTAF